MTADQHTPNQVVEDAVAVLERWLPHHLAEADRLDGDPAGTTPTPATWVMPTNATDLGPDLLPRIATALALGTTAEPTDDDDGVAWELEVHAWVRGDSYEHTSSRVRRYAWAVATVLRQRLNQVHTTRITEVEFAADITQRTLATAVVVGRITQQHAWAHADPYQLDDPPADLTDDPSVGVLTDATIHRLEDISWPEL